MKKMYRLFYILMFLPLIITLIMLPILPNNIPMHYNAQNEIDRWGNKYESLILPLIIIGIGFFLRAMGKLSSKNEINENNSNEKVSITIGIATLLLFNVITNIFLYTGYMQSMVDMEYKLDFNRVIFSVMGIVLIIIGNIMPKCKMNSIIGLRTTWSMKDERTWFLSQRFGGLIFIIAGLITVLGNILFFKGFHSLMFSLGILIFSTLTLVIYAYYIYRRSY